MTFEDFISKWTNKQIDFDGVYPNQCMDLMHFYVYEVLGLTDKSLLSAPSAYQVYTNFKPAWGQYFDKIANTPTGVPNKGDIVLFGQAIGEWGHVCIFVSGDAKTFNSFDANWPTGSLPHIQKHDYKGVLGWLTPKYNTSDPLKDLQGKFNDLMDQFVILKDKYDKLNTAYDEHLAKYSKDLGQKDAQIESLQKTNSELTAQISIMSDQVKGAIDEKKLAQDKLATTLQDLDATTQACNAKDIEISDLKRELSTTFDKYTVRDLLTAAINKALNRKS